MTVSCFRKPRSVGHSSVTKLFLTKPPDPVLPDVSAPGNVLLLGVVGTTKHVIFKVAKFDPSKHPKGMKGLFIDTPDKVKAKDAKIGDVVAAKSGKVFQVEKPTEKGLKVKPVDPDTGEVKSGYTVLGHDLQLAV